MKALVSRDRDQYAVEEVAIDPPKAGMGPEFTFEAVGIPDLMVQAFTDMEKGLNARGVIVFD